VKRAALHEMVEYVTTNRNVLTESTYPEVSLRNRSSLKYFLDSRLSPIIKDFKLERLSNLEQPFRMSEIRTHDNDPASVV